MCNFSLYVNDKFIMEDIMLVEKKDNKIIAVDLFGEVKELSGEIIKIDLNENKIVIKN
ncbi:CooT family nickel-binding protein [Methanothermococcus okinawensis]|uniref:RNA-binding protein n=1 Tax=Methanothermococcus okinawensis (strain DSM 14208 / JCM 11175 / IH1) TaxID=647113 RepID=F8AK72_METOI|nr:CooT family nickel-binding protein [Methanothermococcus okinawensis]AEH07441.1 RNA-binding protein [Methanothermococcus okinawensis IH1]